MPVTYREIRLRERPKGAPTADTFALVEAPMPVPGEGEVLCRTLFLSLDPYMRGRISAAKSYTPGLEPGEAMVGECVAEVVESRHPAFDVGMIVRGMGGWRTHFVLPSDQLRRVDPTKASVSTALGVLGMTGMTAYAGLLAIGRPMAGEIVVVPAATGAVGAVAGQIARIKGCRVVGVAGGAEKCAYAESELGFDRCLDPASPTSPAGSQRPARTASTSMSNSSAERSSTPFSRS